MPPRRKRKSGKGNVELKGTKEVDCIRCGGGKNRCGLCRANNGKVWVSK